MADSYARVIGYVRPGIAILDTEQLTAINTWCVKHSKTLSGVFHSRRESIAGLVEGTVLVIHSLECMGRSAKDCLVFFSKIKEKGCALVLAENNIDTFTLLSEITFKIVANTYSFDSAKYRRILLGFRVLEIVQELVPFSRLNPREGYLEHQEGLACIRTVLFGRELVLHQIPVVPCLCVFQYMWTQPIVASTRHLGMKFRMLIDHPNQRTNRCVNVWIVIPRHFYWLVRNRGFSFERSEKPEARSAEGLHQNATCVFVFGQSPISEQLGHVCVCLSHWS